VQELPPEATVEIAELKRLIAQKEESLREEHATAWDSVQLARHEKRPYTLDYIERLFTSFRPIHGDRRFADDAAMVGGLAFLEDQPVMVIGQQKGRNTKERLFRNYGMAKPEGYRKAIRLMQIAEKFNRPILTFIDTPGAFVHEIGGTDNHVHLAVTIPPTLTISELKAGRHTMSTSKSGSARRCCSGRPDTAWSVSEPRTSIG
jgi:acetyl-CoA carboxylase carboxyl transferase subunit alpha